MLAPYRIIAAGLALALKSGALDSEPPFKAIGQMTGAGSAVEQSRVEMVQDQDAWSKLWQEHTQSVQLNVPQNAQQVNGQDRPKVDFTKNVVLCLFGGQSKNVGGFEIAAVGNVKGLAYVRIRPQLLPLGGTLLLQNPFIFIVLPRTKRKLVVQLDQTALGGEGWRTLATLPATSRD